MSYIERNIAEFQDTREKSLGIYKVETADLISRTKVYQNASGVAISPAPKQEITFVNERTVEAAVSARVSYSKVAALNFADALVAGGLVWQGANTQEESLCRCSNLYESLIKDECKQEYYDYNFYNGGREFSDRLIYSPDVLFIKDDNFEEFVLPYHVDVITIPFPLGDVGTEEIYKRRIKCILHAAAINGVACLVLGAIGCGAFANPVDKVAKAFAEVLSEQNYIENIVFAIVGNGDRDTYTEFKDVFYKYYKG